MSAPAPLRVRLRLPQVEDAVALAQEGDDPRVAAGLRDTFPSPYTVDGALDWVDAALAVTGPQRHWIIEARGQCAGTVSLFPGSDVLRHNCEVGYWLGYRFWGRGLATAAVAQVTAHAFAKLEAHRVYAEVFGTNVASQRVLEKCGFSLEYRLAGIGVKLGETIDIVCWGKRRT